MSCIERSLDVWETTGTLARFVYAQAIGRPDSRAMRQSCHQSGPSRTTQYFVPTQGGDQRTRWTPQALGGQSPKLSAACWLVPRIRDEEDLFVRISRGLQRS